MHRILAFLLILLLCCGCGRGSQDKTEDSSSPASASENAGAGAGNAGSDAVPADPDNIPSGGGSQGGNSQGGGSQGGGSTDGGSSDGGSSDGGSTDGGSTDGGSSGGGSTDGGSSDGGSTDGGSSDGCSSDGCSSDGCSSDGGSQGGGSSDSGSSGQADTGSSTGDGFDVPATLASSEELMLTDEDGTHFHFTYHDQLFRAEYMPDNWKIFDSYRITNNRDMIIICQALSELHPIPSADHSGFRTAEDMAYEWHQHNLAYFLLPDEMKWKSNAKDVDLNSEDQGKNLIDFIIDRSSH